MLSQSTTHSFWKTNFALLRTVIVIERTTSLMHTDRRRLQLFSVYDENLKFIQKITNHRTASKTPSNLKMCHILRQTTWRCATYCGRQPEDVPHTAADNLKTCHILRQTTWRCATYCGRQPEDVPHTAADNKCNWMTTVPDKLQTNSSDRKRKLRHFEARMTSAAVVTTS
jgi:hypothetical protein